MKLKEGQWLEFEDGSKALAEDVIRKEGSLQWAIEDMDLRGIRSWLQSIADGQTRAPLTWFEFESVFGEALSEALSTLGGGENDD